MVNKIYVAIPSYRDGELFKTVYSLLMQANDLNNVFVCVFSQDETHPNLESLFDSFNFKNFKYIKEHYSKSFGVGYARAKSQSALDNTCKYYLQVDSHSQFIKDWDKKLIEDYKHYLDIWGNCILTTYPPGYIYDDYGNIKFTEFSSPAIVKIQKSENENIQYEAKYTTYMGKEDGQSTGYFCAGFAFGYAKYFIDTPYDEKIYFNGEEQTMSIRFFEKGVKLICPNSIYLYHDYDGFNRIRNWEQNEDWHEKNRISSERLRAFFNYEIKDRYGLSNKDSIKNWAYCYVQKAE